MKLRKKILALGLSVILSSISVCSSYGEDYRDAGIMTKVGQTVVSKTSDGGNGATYYLHNVDGQLVYVPFNSTMTGETAFTNMFTKLFDIYQTGLGSSYTTTAGRFLAGNGLSSINNIATQYFVKKYSLEDGESNFASYDMKGVEEYSNLEFRYAGIVIGRDPDVSYSTEYEYDASVVTNNRFPSDPISQSGSSSEAQTYYQFAKDQQSYIEHTFYGSTSESVRGNFVESANYSGIPTNEINPVYQAAYPNNTDISKETFEYWAETTPIGAKYKEFYTTNPFGWEWWEYLDKYFRIDGDYTEQSAFFTTVFSYEGSVYYNTYFTPIQVKNNVIASRLQIKDLDNEIVEYSDRPLVVDEAITGVNAYTKNVRNGTVTLERSKTYQLEAAFTFFSDSLDESVTDKSDTAALPYITIYDTSSSEVPLKTYQTTLASSMQELSADLRESLDTTTTGKMKTKTTKRVPLNGFSNKEINYNVGTSVYNQLSICVDESFPEQGTIRITVPAIYAENGDNMYQNDDYLDIDFTLTGFDGTTEETTTVTEAYGDLNLGEREYRRYHYFQTDMVDDLDKPIFTEAVYDAAGNITAEPEFTGEYEQKAVDYEYATGFGHYESPLEGDIVQEWEGIPSAGDDIYIIDNESWWEYADEWPNQSEDLQNKLWLTRIGESWSSGDEEYYRSETGDYPFQLATSVARSRGQDSDYIEPRIVMQIYGVSPDTDATGDLLETTFYQGNGIPTYIYNVNNYIYTGNTYIAERYDGVTPNGDYPQIRVEAWIADSHGESGIFGGVKASPYQNGWQDEHDTVERTFFAKEDDMELTDIHIRDSEGITIYHATRDEGEDWEVKVDGYFDREEDLVMSVQVKQTVSAGHDVKNPTINVDIDGTNRNGGKVVTLVDRTLTVNETMGLDVVSTFDYIAFRPENVMGINFTVEINDTHSSTEWRENQWDSSTDSYSGHIDATTANLKVTPEIELYNSKNNEQSFLSFSEELDFKFDIQHIGEGAKETAVVGNSAINPLAKVDVAIYNVDLLTKDAFGELAYDNVKYDDPNANRALLWTGEAQAESRLFPGAGNLNYASHVQAWVKDFVIADKLAYYSPSNNCAVYGNILVTAELSEEMFTYGKNENTDSSEDYTQQQFLGEQNISIIDMVLTGQNSITDNSWYYGDDNRDPETGNLIQDNKAGITASIAVYNEAMTNMDSTVIDRMHLDVYIGDEEEPYKTMIIEVPRGDVVAIALPIPDLEILEDLQITAKVNYGEHQTHYEYVSEATDAALNLDPFSDNVAVRTVSPNLPDKENAPNADIIDGLPGEIDLGE